MAAQSTQSTALPDDALARWERRATPFIIAAAIVPLLPVITDAERDVASTIVELVAWAVFLVDLAVHIRLRRGYLRTGMGLFDLVVVIGTFPWYLIPGLGGAAVLGLLRLARIARILAVGLRTAPLQRLARRLGPPAVVVLASVFVAAAIVWRTEPERYETYGDGVWWAFVTVTTVGYGDFTPDGAAGRVTAVVLMLVGVALLGVVAASLASFFGEDSAGGTEQQPAQADPTRELAATIEQLRTEVAALRAELGTRPGPEA